MRCSSFAALLTLAACVACSTGPADDAPPAVEVSILSVDLDAQVITGTMRNVGGKVLTFGDCSAGLETRASGDWVRVPREGACDMWGGRLSPGKAAEIDVPLPSVLPDCPLRVAVGLGVEGFLDWTAIGHSSEFCPEVD